ncbi:DUF3558 family protein [Demequina pelophila]|uniref:DUF3558 family protein n=1 Tax=Demequina pelophila TaxID=1638984 RepID=UPI00078252A8|nr:DUF3558 family protein [Demequina pelophila]
MTFRPGLVATALAATALLAACTPSSTLDDSTTPSPGVSAEPTAGPTSDAATEVEAAPELPAGVPDPCDLLTVEEIAEASGVTLEEGVVYGVVTNSQQAACLWRTPAEDSSTPRLQVTLSWSDASFDERRAIAEETFGEVEDGEIDGADAVFITGGGRSVSIEAGGYYAKISYIDPDRDVRSNRSINGSLSAVVAGKLG